MKKLYAMVTGLALGLGVLMSSAAVEGKGLFDDLLGPELAAVVRPIAAPLSVGTAPGSVAQTRLIQNNLSQFYNRLPPSSFGQNLNALIGMLDARDRLSVHVFNLINQPRPYFCVYPILQRCIMQ